MKRVMFVIVLAFSVAACSQLQVTETPPNQVTIKRDTYGVPHIYAETVYGLFYGYGYAIAQDRLFSMEMAKHSGQGRVSEFLGVGDDDKYINFDRRIRSMYKPDAILNQLANLPGEDKAVFDGYAAGINAHIAEVRNNPAELMPQQFNTFGFEPEDWTAFDVAMIFVGSMVNRFGDFNTELANLNIYTALTRQHGQEKGMRIFNQLMPQVVKGAPTTISSDDWIASDSSGSDHALDLQSALAMTLEDPLSVPNQGEAFSNMVIVGRKKADGAKSILMNGPQFGWYFPSYVYSVGLHGAGFDLVGNTPYGYPVILFGHNGHIAWGSTWGAGDMIDMYQEKLNPDNPEEYWHNDGFVAMEKRIETIKVKGGQDAQLPVYRTFHGPVVRVDEKNHVAFAKKRTWEGLELDTLLGWMHTTRAKNHTQWLKQAERSALNINMYYADKDGNIGYAFTGKYPKRKAGHDNRLPVSGEGHMDWEGIHTFDYNPKVYNPEQGFIANWNNRPAYGVLNPDMFWYSWSKADRVEVLIERVAQKDRLTADDLWDLIYDSSLTDVNARYFIPFMETAAQTSDDPKLKQAVADLSRWNHMSEDVNSDGKYDETSTAVFRTFLPFMLAETLQDDLGDVFKFFGGTGYPTPEKPFSSGLNLQIGTKTVVEALVDPESQAFDFFNGENAEAVILRALEKTMAALEEKFGPDMNTWRLPMAPTAFTHKNFLGIPQADASESQKLPVAMNRGTENDMVVFTSQGVKAYEVAPPGQSGFISPQGVKSKHYDDQMQMYADYQKKSMWLDPDNVEENMVSTVVLFY
jgi:penicillin G amidase